MAVINILKSNKNLPSTLLLSLCSLFSINTLAIDFNHDIDCKDGSCSLKGTINSEAEISFIGGEIELHTKKVDQDGFYQRKKVSLNEESKEIILNDAGSRFEEPELFPTTALKEGEKAALKYLVTKLEDSAALEKNKGIKYAINSYVNEVHGHERSFAVTAFAPDGARIIDKTVLDANNFESLLNDSGALTEAIKEKINQIITSAETSFQAHNSTEGSLERHLGPAIQTAINPEKTMPPDKLPRFVH